MSWLKYLWATLIGFVVTVAVATSSAILILWLDLSRYVEPVSDGLVLGIDPGIWYGILVVAACIFIGLFVGTVVGTTVGIPPSSKLKTGHFEFQTRLLGSETGHYLPPGREHIAN